MSLKSSWNRNNSLFSAVVGFEPSLSIFTAVRYLLNTPVNHNIYIDDIHLFDTWWFIRFSQWSIKTGSVSSDLKNLSLSRTMMFLNNSHFRINQIIQCKSRNSNSPRKNRQETAAPILLSSWFFPKQCKSNLTEHHWEENNFHDKNIYSAGAKMLWNSEIFQMFSDESVKHVDLKKSKFFSFSGFVGFMLFYLKYDQLFHISLNPKVFFLF